MEIDSLLLYDVTYRTAGIIQAMPVAEALLYDTLDIIGIRNIPNGKIEGIFTPDDPVIDTLIELRYLGAWFNLRFDEDGTLHFDPVPKCTGNAKVLGC